MDRSFIRVVSIRVALCGLLLTTLASCGGGGGGGGGGPALRFSANPTQLAYEFSEGDGASSQMVVVNATGEYSGTLYVAAVVEGEGIDPNIPVSISGTQGSFQISVLNGLAQGTYAGRILLMACSDPACNRQIGNSPLPIRYTIDVLPPLSVTPGSLDVSVASGATATRTLTVQRPAGQSSFTAEVTSGSEWLRIANHAAASFDLEMTSLPSGTYQGAVQVRSGTSTRTLAVTYRVSPPAGGDRFLAAQPGSLTLATVEGETAGAVPLQVTAPSWDPAVSVTTQYQSESGWLTVSPVAGGYQVIASAGNLSAGSYGATIRLHAAYPSNDVLVPVVLTVGTGLVRPADEIVSIDVETLPSDLTRSIAVNKASGSAVAWSASSDSAWAVLTQSSGMTGQALGITVDSGYALGMTNGSEEVANVTITAPGTPLTPVTFAVRLSNNLPSVTGVGPYVQPAGVPIRVILRGEGFAGVADLAGRVSVEGGVVESFTRLSDTEVVVNLGPMSAGTHVVSVSNALGWATPTSDLTIVAPPAYSYAAVPTGSPLRSLTYDAERNAIYAVKITSESLARFRATGGGWITDSMPIPVAYDSGLTNDGSRLLVTTNDFNHVSRIHIIDPDSFTVSSVVTASSTFMPTFTYLGMGIHTTIDGRTWLGLDSFAGSGQWAGPLTFNAVTEAFAPVPITIPTSFHGGPWYAMSRDGERLIIVQSGSISPSPPMLYRDSADGVVHVNQAGLTFEYRFSLSDDGNRVMLGSHRVRDRGFALVGNIQLPAGYFAFAGQMAPDGSRGYMLAYPNNASMSSLPRVFVIDTSSFQDPLPVLGYFDLPDSPTCPSCQEQGVVAAAISIDGSTLFFGGATNLIVAPVPEVLTPLSLAASPARTSAPKTTPWVLRSQ